MDDRDLATRLRESSRRVMPMLQFDAVERGREAGRRRRQRRDAAAAVVVSMAVIGGLFAGLRFQSSSGTRVSAGDGSGTSATQPPLGAGQFLYIMQAIVSDAGRIV